VPKKKRPDPYTQGVMAKIYEWFVGPLVIKHKPHQQSINEFLEQTFDFKNREIIRYVATRDFVLPGLYYSAPLMKVQGIGYRDIKQGTELWVRKDARVPDTVDVEFMGGQGGKDQVFALSRSEWDWAALNLEEAERVRRD
jgi:hypothetical protein